MDRTDNKPACKYRGESILHAFSVEGLFSFRGRRNRKAYIVVLLFCEMLSTFVMLLGDDYVSGKFPCLPNVMDLVVYGLFLIICLLINLSNAVKRGHDVGISGWITGAIIVLGNFARAFGSYYSISIKRGYELTWSSELLGHSMMFLLFVFCLLLLVFELELLFKSGDKMGNVYGVNPIITQQKDEGYFVMTARNNWFLFIPVVCCILMFTKYNELSDGWLFILNLLVFFGMMYVTFQIWLFENGKEVKKFIGTIVYGVCTLILFPFFNIDLLSVEWQMVYLVAGILVGIYFLTKLYVEKGYVIQGDSLFNYESETSDYVQKTILSKHIFSVDKRLSRIPYNIVALLVVLVTFICCYMTKEHLMSPLFAILGVWIEAVLFIKRVNDIGLSGGWLLFVVVLIGCSIVEYLYNEFAIYTLLCLMIVLFLTLSVIPGSCGKNVYGDNPLE